MLILEYSPCIDQSRISYFQDKYLKITGASVASPLDPPRGLRALHGPQLHWNVLGCCLNDNSLTFFPISVKLFGYFPE